MTAAPFATPGLAFRLVPSLDALQDAIDQIMPGILLRKGPRPVEAPDKIVDLVT